MKTITSKILQIKENGTWKNVEMLSNGDGHSVAMGNALVPVYIGDYMNYNYGPQSMCVVGDKVYTANVNETEQLAEHSDNGLLRIFDITNNTELTALAKEVPMGHANSMCYDYGNENFYVAPGFTYTNGTKQDALFVNKYDYNFNFIESIATPTLAQAISYDPVTRSLYYYGWASTCYQWNGSGWTKVCDFDFSAIKHQIRSSHHRFNQDFAVYNGRFYLSSSSDNLISGLLLSETSTPDSSYVYSTMESRCRFRLGETEGMEFTPDGHLFSVNATTLANNVCDSFILELPVGEQVPYATNLGGNYDSYGHGEVTLNNASVASFALDLSTIRSLAQLSVLDCVTSVYIPGDANVTDDAVIRISRHDVMLKIDGHYTCQKFEVYGGHLNFRPGTDRSGDDWHITCTSSESPIDASRAGRVSFTGSRGPRFNLPNRNTRYGFVNVSNSKSITITSYIPTTVQGLGRLQVNGTDMTYDMLMVGNVRFPLEQRTITWHYTSNSYVLQEKCNCSVGYVDAYSASTLKFDIELNQPLPVNTEIEIGQFEMQTWTPWIYNVASQLGGANIQVKLGTRGAITISTAGTTLENDRYATSLVFQLADDNW